MKHVIIVNGKPLTGKTSFNLMARNYIEDCEIGHCHIISTVTKIYDIYRMLGWNGEKTDQFRDDMSILKQMYTRNCNGPTRDILQTVLTLDDNGDDHFLFVDCREASEITKLVTILNAVDILGIRCHTMYIKRAAVDTKVYSNESDNNQIDHYKYDIIIDNNGTLDELKAVMHTVIDAILEAK